MLVFLVSIAPNAILTFFGTKLSCGPEDASNVRDESWSISSIGSVLCGV